jgi:myo-inositol-1(or 4)-monophosphatase
MKKASLQPDVNAALAAAVNAARAAGKIMRANWHKPKRVNSAEAHDIKLELDVQCQKLIETRLRRRFPEIPLLGEEGISGDMNAEYRWVVDPIDGTVNYFFGLPHAAVSIALEIKTDVRTTRGRKNSIPRNARNPVTHHSSHVTLVGVIYDPFTDELWTAVRGGKTKLNGKTVRVSKRARLDEAIIAIGFSKSRENLDQSLPHLNRLARRVKKIRVLGSAALELAYVASGRLDAYIERRINLWDVAAGSLLVERAGGEFYARPVPGKFRYTMCADNGLLRKKLQVTSLLK